MEPRILESNTDRRGNWSWGHPNDREGWFGLPGRGIPDLEISVQTFLYELFGRGEGYGVLLSQFKAEHFLGNTGPQYEWYVMNTDFLHRLARHVGAENIFAAARQGNDYFQNWLHRQIQVNPQFRFTNAELHQVLHDLRGEGPVLDRNMPFIDLNFPQSGVHSQIMIGDFGPPAQRRPHIFPEVAEILQSLAQQQQNTLANNNNIVQPEQPLPPTPEFQFPVIPLINP